MTEPYTTRALLGDKMIYLDDCYPEGEILTVREDFDDENSPLIGYYLLARDENQWVLKESDYQPPRDRPGCGAPGGYPPAGPCEPPRHRDCPRSVIQRYAA